MRTMPTFFWYELITTDPKSAAGFYADVVGWTPRAFPGGMDYTVLEAEPDYGTAGIMAVPPEAKSDGTGPMWLGYLYAADTDQQAKAIEAAGGRILRQPADIPTIGRFAVVADPQGTPFMIMAPQGPDRAPLPHGTPGTIGWRDLSTPDPQAAWTFYSQLFGWTKGDAIPMGEMGDYQLFHAGEEAPEGGLMKSRDPAAHPAWHFYFYVPAIDAARDRVVKGGGTIIMEPMEVPGGQWALDARDPQGALFGLVAPKR